ncbi:unnamed protein product [Rotaria sordida]|uniref:Msx2-interacting protein n=1 Tax=Rotaria sordida TaxID=392033 RepID=A0A814KJ87_9BILA|nr:unnamed protein product [Rotaria sordida]
MSSEISTDKVLLTSKSTESRCLMISNLPDTATEETIKECFERHGHVQTVKINDQRFALVAFLDIRTALKAHRAENILDKKQLQTTFHDSLNSVPKVLLEVSSSIIEPSSSPCSITTETNTFMDKTITAIHDNRDIYSLHTANNRHQIVRVKYESDLSRSKPRTSSINSSKKTIMKSSRDKHENSSSSSSSSESERSHNDSLFYKYRRQYTLKLKQKSANLNHLKTRILKIYPLPSKISIESLRETLRNIFINFKKSSHLLNIKIIDDYALLTFKKFEDVNKALLFIITKSIHGIKLKAKPYNYLIHKNDLMMKRSICSDLDTDEYSVKATRTLYIGNLQPEISSNELREIYSTYGDIIQIEIKRQQQQSHYLQTFAFIQYVNIKSVIKAMKSKFIRDHSIKLGFGKSQPTNVLWLDNLPSNITESILRSFINNITNLSSNEILDIYIDNRNYHQIHIVQCLIYFIDIIAAQHAINSIRGKKIQSKRIQVDFASKILITRFSDIIQETNNKKNNNQSTNRSHQCHDTKTHHAESSLTPSNINLLNRNETHHHLSSSLNYDSINHKKIIKSETEKNTNTEHICDCLMQNHHLNINHNDVKEYPKKQIENKKKLNEISISNTNSYHSFKKVFPTKIIPLESDSSFVQTDIRLQVYSSQYNQLINSIYLPFPKFAKISTKSLNILNKFNSKAHLEDLSFQLNNISTKKDLVNTNMNNKDLSIHKELNERIKLLDENIDEFNRNSSLLSPAIFSQQQNQTITTAHTSSIQIERNTILNAQQTSSCNFTLSPILHSSDSTLSIQNVPTVANYNSISSTTPPHPLIPTSFISSSTSTNQSSPLTSNDKSSRNLPPLLFDTNNNSSNIIPIKSLEQLDPKFQHKSISSLRSVIANVPKSSNINDSSVIPTSELITFSSIKGNQNHSSSSIILPISQQQVTDDFAKPIVLKSILKQSCNLSQSTSNETCKIVQIMSKNPSFESKVKQTLLLDNNKKPTNKQIPNLIINNMKKHQTEMKKLSNQSIISVNSDKKQLLENISKKFNTKLIETTKKSSKNVTETSTTSLNSKVSQSTIKHLDQINQKTKLVQNHNKIEKKSSSSISIQQNKTFLSHKTILKHKQQHQNNQTNKNYLTTMQQNSLNKSSISISKIDNQKNKQKLIIKSNNNNKTSENFTNNTSQTKLKLKQITSMYDRIKNRSRNEQIAKSLLTTKNDHLSEQNNDDDDIQITNVTQLKRHNIIMDSSESEDDMLTKIKNKKRIDFDSNIFDSEENDHNNQNKIKQQQMEISKFNNEELVLKKKPIISKANSLSKKRSTIDQLNLSSKKIKLQSKHFPSVNKQSTITFKISSPEQSLNNTITENITLNKIDTTFSNHSITTIASSSTTTQSDDYQSITMNTKKESILLKSKLTNNETYDQLNTSIDSNCYEQKKSMSSPVTNNTQQDSFNEQQILNETEQTSYELSSHIPVDKSTSLSIENSSPKETIQVSQSSSIISKDVSISTILCETIERTLNVTNNFLLDNINSSNLPIDDQSVITNTSIISIPTTLSDIKKSSCFSSSVTNETLNLFDCRSITNNEHSSKLMRLFPQLITPDSNLFMPHHQYYSYSLVAQPSSNSPPLSIRTLSTSSSNSTIGNPCYNTNMSEQQYCHDEESKRDSITNFSTTSSFDCSTPNNTIDQQQSLESDSITSFRNLSELYGYAALPAQQSLNSFTSEYCHMNDFQSYDPYNIQWEGYIILKTNQAYIKTQFIAGNPHIARISINYWHSDIHHNLRISQRMRLEQIQLDGVQQRMKIDNDHCILIAEPNGLTPDEIRSEQNHLKNGVIQYLQEKQAAGILNILLPGLLQPVYVVHIFPPCQFASEILQKRAPDAYRCIVQNKIEKIYLLFIITSTIQ